MKIIVADVIWTPADADVPTAGAIRVERHLSGWQRTPQDRWMPAASAFELGYETKGDTIKQLLSLFILFNTITVRDGVNVAKAHNAFLAIDEYRRSISPDAPGASP
jgi:hypothetical protein